MICDLIVNRSTELVPGEYFTNLTSVQFNPILKPAYSHVKIAYYIDNCLSSNENK